ncbi:gastrula zinc finger protein XlCGF57.1-like [Cydia amplana]|uniref:gastrula zinc finger protein XlCGF57.1-like n=1 Tax=Cydia amplana TaxID=1869771 RepID=UPI002FE52A5F
MSDQTDTYCRLCAETTPITQLITAEDDVAVSSKVLTKMQWINIDITSTVLPTTICFSCFDLLERTWAFLHNARTAQVKLASIFVKKTVDDQSASNSREKKSRDNVPVTKPVDKDWEDFQTTKHEVKVENSDQLDHITTVDASTLLQIDFQVKSEQLSDNEHYDNSIDSEGFSSDSNAPLVEKKKKSKRKKGDYELNDLGVSLTWEEYMCRCAQCDAQCKNMESLQLHSLQIHSCCCVFKCLDCDKVISSYRSFINHVRTHNKSLRRCCEYCNKRFSSSSCLKKHVSNAHRKSYLTTCSNCGSNFETPELLQDHILIYSRSQKKHRKQEALDSDLKCEHCHKEFKSRSNLQQHKLVHMERNREFACHICGKMFFTKGTLSTHMNTHEDSKPHKCEFCPLAFRARGNLISHISLHSGAKPFVCEQCGKSFRVKRHLKSHSIVHTDLMPYVCEYCNKQFRFKTRLNLHLRQHTGAKPYTCIFCQRDFTNGSNYKKHMKRRHNIDTSKKKFNSVGKDEMDNQATIQAVQATVQATIQAIQATQA